MFNKVRRTMKDHKGFTLVELIVVLVILAILATMLVPTLTGYIDKARKQSIISETRSVVIAAQTLASESYGQASVGSGGIITIANTVPSEEIKALAEVKGTISAVRVSKNNTASGISGGTIIYLKYTNGANSCVYYPSNAANNTDGDYDVNAAPCAEADQAISEDLLKAVANG